MRILIVSYLFPPHNAIGTVRLGKLAKYLRGLGHEVRVVAAQSPLPAGDQSLPLEIPREDVVYTRRTEVNAFGKKILSAILPRKGAAAAKSPTEYYSSLDAVPRPLRWLARLYITLFNIPDAAVGWYRPAVRAATTLVREWKPDVIYASGGPFTGLLVAARVARTTGTPWVAELRDPWADNQCYPYFEWRRGWDRRMERKTLQTAKGLVAVSEPWAEPLRKEYDLPVAVVTNGFDSDDYPSRVSRPRTGPLEVAYTGTFYTDQQDPAPLFEVLRRDRDLAEQVHVSMYVLNHVPALREFVQRAGVADSVSVCDPVTYADSLRKQVEADALLLVLGTGPNQSGWFPGKFFEYLGARRPVLVLADEDNVAGRVVNSRSLGLASQDPDQIAQWLGQCLERKQRGELEDHNPSAVARFSRYEQTRVLDGFLASLL